MNKVNKGAGHKMKQYIINKLEGWTIGDVFVVSIVFGIVISAMILQGIPIFTIIMCFVIPLILTSLVEVFGIIIKPIFE